MQMRHSRKIISLFSSRFGALAVISFFTLHGFSNLHARELFFYKSTMDVESSAAEVTRTLDTIDPDGYNMPEETSGFYSIYSSGFFSPFDYKIFVGRISNTNPTSIIRVEASEGDGLVISRILESNGAIKDDSIPYPTDAARKSSEKSYFISQSLNLIAPWLAIPYNGYDSPSLSRGQIWYNSALYFLADIILAGAGGTNFFQERFDASEHGDLILAGLAINRLVGSIQSIHSVRANNRTVKLEYTFYFD